MTDDSKDYSVLLLDEYGANELRSDKDRKNLILKYYKYTVLILREGINSFNIGLHSIKELVYRDNVYKLEDDILKKVELSDDELRSKNCIITEDSKSAYQYFKYYFGESKLIVDYAKKGEKDLTGGNGNFIRYTLNKIEQGKNIVGLIDYDMGGGIIYNIKENYINEYRNVTFIAAECFEQMILYHAMIYDKLNENEKDMVENFYNYISCDYKHRGLYFLELCQKIFKARNTSLYQKNNIKCLIEQCCFRKNLGDICKFNTNNKDFIFRGKYEVLTRLYNIHK